MLALGLRLGVVDIDLISGTPRCTLNNPNLLDGIEFTVVAIGVFGLGQMFSALGEKVENRAAPKYTFRSLFSRLSDIILCWEDLLVDSIVDFAVGILPGSGATASTILSYAAPSACPRTRKGSARVPSGRRSARSCQQRYSYAAMIPLLTLGIPGSATTAVMLGGLLMLGLQDGSRRCLGRPGRRHILRRGTAVPHRLRQHPRARMVSGDGRYRRQAKGRSHRRGRRMRARTVDDPDGTGLPVLPVHGL